MSKEKFKLSKGELGKVWKQGIENKEEFSKGGGYDVYEDGRYHVAVTDCERAESQSSGRDQVMFEYTFLEGDYKGKTKRDFFGLDRAESIPYLIKHIEALGFEAPEDIDELETVLKKIVKAHPKIKVRLKTKGDYQNVYLEKILSEEEGADLEIPEAEDQDLPKDKVSRETPAPETAPAEEGGEVEKGSRVKVLEEDEKTEVGIGEIVAIDEEAGEATVKLDSGKKVIVPGHLLRLAPKEAAPAPKPKGLKLKG